MSPEITHKLMGFYIEVLILSGLTPQVASLAAHVYVWASKLHDVKDKCMLVVSFVEQAVGSP